MAIANGHNTGKCPFRNLSDNEQETLKHQYLLSARPEGLEGIKVEANKGSEKGKNVNFEVRLDYLCSFLSVTSFTFDFLSVK